MSKTNEIVERLSYFLERFFSEQKDIFKGGKIPLSDLEIHEKSDCIQICFRIQSETVRGWYEGDCCYYYTSNSICIEWFLKTVGGISELKYKKIYSIMNNSFGKEFTNKYKKMELIKKLIK
jgi:hypothetical protein